MAPSLKFTLAAATLILAFGVLSLFLRNETSGVTANGNRRMAAAKTFNPNGLYKTLNGNDDHLKLKRTKAVIKANR